MTAERERTLDVQEVCKIVQTRAQLGLLLNALDLVGEAAEIGVLEGEYSEHLLYTWKGKMLHLIDPWDEYGANTPTFTSKEGHDRRLVLTMKRLQPYKERYTVWRQMSETACQSFTDGQLDFVFIDGNHSYDFVVQDLELWYPKVKAGGIIACHDYMFDKYHKGIHVKMAVDRFVAQRGLILHVTKDQDVNPSAFFVRV